MAQDSDDSLFVVNIVVWVWVVILEIVALHWPLPRRIVRWCTIWCNKSVISLLGLMLVSHLSLLLWGDASFGPRSPRRREARRLFRPANVFYLFFFYMAHLTSGSHLSVRPSHWDAGPTDRRPVDLVNGQHWHVNADVSNPTPPRWRHPDVSIPRVPDGDFLFRNSFIIFRKCFYS